MGYATYDQIKFGKLVSLLIEIYLFILLPTFLVLGFIDPEYSGGLIQYFSIFSDFLSLPLSYAALNDYTKYKKRYYRT